MGAINKRGVWVPATGDGLLEAWETMASKIGAYMPVASTAAARAALNAAEAAGMGATSSNPILFLIGSGVAKVAYVADGTKTSSKWNLAPLNEVQVDEQSWGKATTYSLSQGTFSSIITSQLPSAPFDRVVTATGYAYSVVNSGRVNLALRIGDATNQSEARIDGSGDPTTTTVTNQGIIAADTAPVIRLGVVGDSPHTSSSITLATADKLSRMVVTAFPISMVV